MRTTLINSTMWNLGSFAIVAIAGLALNLAVGRIYGPSVLGQFNIVIAIYIIASQLSTFGIHFGLLQKLSYAFHGGQRTREELGVIVSNALGLVAVLAIAVCAILVSATIAAPRLFPNDAVTVGVLIVTPGLFFFSLNKTLFAALNALELLRQYAIGQALRYIFIMTWLGVWIGFGLSGTTLPTVLTLSEVVLTLFLWPSVQFRARIRWPDLTAESTRELINFGLRALWSGMATEINTKVDILVLSAFASTAEVGVYSIAALIFEGLAQIPFVLRTVVNSKLSVLTQRERVDELRVFFRPIKWAMIVGMTAVALVTVLLFPVFVDLILGDTTFRQAWLPLTILLFSLAAASGYLPLDMVLTQGRQPMAQSLLKTLVVSINLIMNILLVPFFGMIGAAMGTACATISTAILTVVMMHRYLGVHA